MKLHIGIPTVTPLFERCVTDAIRRTRDLDCSLYIHRGPGSHGQKLDEILADLPADAEWFCTMDDDAAPLLRGWMSWMIQQIGSWNWGGFRYTRRGVPHPMGAFYRVSWLREIEASFLPDDGYDVGERFGRGGEPGFICEGAPAYARPWWLKRADVAIDEHRWKLLFAHLGGETVGPNSWRIPNWLWPILVRRYLRRIASC